VHSLRGTLVVTHPLTKSIEVTTSDLKVNLLSIFEVLCGLLLMLLGDLFPALLTELLVPPSLKSIVDQIEELRQKGKVFDHLVFFGLVFFGLTLVL